MQEKILDILRKYGPLLPVEIASKIGADSFVVQAYLSQLKEAGKIKASKERIGNTFLYFCAGQEAIAQKRAAEILSQPIKVGNYKTKETQEMPELRKKREEFAQKLKELEEREAKLKQAKEDFIGRFKSAIMPLVKEQPEPKPEPKPKKKVLFGPKEDVVELALGYLIDRGAEILSKEIKKKGREADIVVTIPSGIGPIKMFVKVKDKKSINEADLSLTYTEGQSRKLPILFLTTGKLTKTAENYLKVIGGLLKVKFLK